MTDELAALRARVAELQDCAADWSRQANDLLAENGSLSARVAELEAENQALHGRIVESDYAGLKHAAELEAALREVLEFLDSPPRYDEGGFDAFADVARRALGDTHG